MSGFSGPTLNDYKATHDYVRQYLHWKTSNWYDFKTVDNQYEFHSDLQIEGDNATIFEDFVANIDKTKEINRSAVRVNNTKEGTCLFTNMGVPTNKSISFNKFNKLMICQN